MIPAARLAAEVQRLLADAPVWSGYVRGAGRREAELLVGHALGVDLLDPANLHTPVTRADVDAVNTLLRRRVHDRVPVPYLVGETVYDGLRLRVEPGTFIPRNALQFVLDEVVAEVPWGRGATQPRALDLCCGVGAVGVAVARRHPGVRVDQVDLDAHAVDVAKDNAVRHGVDDRCRQFVGDLFAPLPPGRRYDLVTVNPPYIPDSQEQRTCGEVRNEPRGAVFSPGDGLSLTRAVLASVAPWLRDDGVLVLEVGPSQHDHVDWLLAGRGRWWSHRGRPLHLVSIDRRDLVR